MSEEEEGNAAPNSKRLHSSHASGMESSILRFKDVNFIVGTGDKAKNILTDVSGTVRWGRKWKHACIHSLLTCLDAHLTNVSFPRFAYG